MTKLVAIRSIEHAARQANDPQDIRECIDRHFGAWVRNSGARSMERRRSVRQPVD